MKKFRVGINGFGRIGRLFLRRYFEDLPKDFEVVAINDLGEIDQLIYLLKYDSAHGIFQEEITQTNDDEICIGDHHKIKILNHRNLEDLNWEKLGVDYVIEATGIFITEEDARKHIDFGKAKRVLISAPAKGNIPTLVMGVNHENYNPKKDFIISNASCTTNCLAPLVKILHDHFQIEEGLMTTVHAVTATQTTTDSFSKKDYRQGRAAFQNIIPASTGAAKAVALCIPEIEGKITGMAFRVPVIDVSVVDFNVRLSKGTSFDSLYKVLKEEANSRFKNILACTEDSVVSSDILGRSESSIFDKQSSFALNDNFFKLISWYDNEYGYVSRLIDLTNYMAKLEG